MGPMVIWAQKVGSFKKIIYSLFLELQPKHLITSSISLFTFHFPTPSTMEALICRNLGDPTAPMTATSPIAVSLLPPPTIGTPTEVLIRIHSASLNYGNYLQIIGKYQEKPPFPFIPGSDFSGVVESVGDDVSKFKIGDRVCSFVDLGAYAEMIVLDEKHL